MIGKKIRQTRDDELGITIPTCHYGRSCAENSLQDVSKTFLDVHSEGVLKLVLKLGWDICWFSKFGKLT